jgi:MSHA biogenesis protein MshI
MFWGEDTLINFFKKKSFNDSLLGISFSADGVALAHVTHQSDKPHLLHCEFQPLSTEDDPVSVLQMRIKQLGLQKVPVNTCLSADEFSLLMLEAPNVETEEMQQAIRWNLRDQIDFDIEQAALDVFEIPRQTDRSRTPMVYVVVARNQTIQQRVTQMEAAEVNLQYIDIPQLAQRNISLLMEEDQTGVALLTLNNNTGLLTLCHQTNLYLTREIEQTMMQAEPALQESIVNTELQLADQTSAQQLAINNVVLELQRSLDYYESHFALPPINNLVLSPTDEPLNEIAEMIAQTSGMRVKLCQLNELIDSDIELTPHLQTRCFQAIGLALREVV